MDPRPPLDYASRRYNNRRVRTPLLVMGAMLLPVAIAGFWVAVQLSQIDYPVPGPEPVDPTPTSNDLVIPAIFCGTLVAIALTLIVLAFRGKRISPDMP